MIGLLAAIFILPEVYGFEHDAGLESAAIGLIDRRSDRPGVERRQADAAVGGAGPFPLLSAIMDEKQAIGRGFWPASSPKGSMCQGYAGS